MKKTLFALMGTAGALCIGFQSANASLIGMPLNLKAAIQISDVATPSTVCQFYTDDVLTGTLTIKACWRA